MIGWLSSVCLILCGIPLALDAYKSGQSNINNIFFSLWLSGEVFGVIHTINIGDYPLVANYSINLLILLVVLYYKIFPRNSA